MANNNNKCVFYLGFILINILITISCKGCWKVSIGLIGFSFCFKGIVIICLSNNQNTVHPRENITELTSNNIIVTINNTPDFSRLYIEENQSPLHKPIFTCCICLDETEENIKTLLCGHNFHKECIEGWFMKEESCPLCRDEFDDI